ncbi:MAG TPA: hypothetical protein PLT66_02435 [Bacillota bacterium]|nr:hypothetical protein [Bacillota bacterium]
MPDSAVEVAALFVKLPNETPADVNAFYQVPDGKAMVLFENFLYDQYAVIENGEYYIDYKTVRNLFDRRFYWSGSDELLTFTTPTSQIRAYADSCDYYTNKAKNTDSNPVVKVFSNEPFISLTFLKRFADITATVFAAPDRVVIRYNWGTQYQTTQVTAAALLRTQASDQGEILAQLPVGEELIFIKDSATDSSGYAKVMTTAGLIGFVDTAKLGTAVLKSDVSPNEPDVYTHITKDYSISMVTHSITTQADNDDVLSFAASYSGLTTICPSWFSLLNTNGELTSLASEVYVERMHNSDIEVWAQITDSEADINAALADTASRDKLKNAIISNIIKYDIDGVVIRFENITTAGVPDYMQFLRELSISCRNNGFVLSTDSAAFDELLKEEDKEEIERITDFRIPEIS